MNTITKLLPAFLMVVALSVPMQVEAKKKKHKASSKTHHSKTHQSKTKKKHKSRHASSAMIRLPAKRHSPPGYASAAEYLRIGYQD